jgi:hypothetical protein
MKGKPETMALEDYKPSIHLDKKDIPAVDNFDFGDKLTITISGKVISKNKDSICIEYGKGDCELSDEVSEKASKMGVGRKDYKALMKKRAENKEKMKNENS